jgi:hypothetical protein
MRIQTITTSLGMSEGFETFEFGAVNFPAEFPIMFVSINGVAHKSWVRSIEVHEYDAYSGLHRCLYSHVAFLLLRWEGLSMGVEMRA